MLGLTTLAFPGKPRWDPESRRVELLWRCGEEAGTVVVPASALSLLAGRGYTEHKAITAVYLRRAELESVAAAKLNRRRTKRGGTVTLDARDIETIALRLMA